MEIKIVKKKISKQVLVRIVRENYGEMIKVDVDIRKEIISLGGEWHSEGDELLHDREGSARENIWGVNFYPWKFPKERIQYNSLINIKPSMGHLKMEIQDKAVKQKIKIIIEKLLLADDETL